MKLISFLLFLAWLSMMVFASERAYLNIGATILPALESKVLKHIQFPAHQEGSAAELVLGPDDNGAAILSVKGKPGRAINIAIEDKDYYLFLISEELSETGSGMKLSSFTYGGELTPQGNAVIDEDGELDDMRIGATLAIEDGVLPGDYQTTVVVAMAYQ